QPARTADGRIDVVRAPSKPTISRLDGRSCCIQQGGEPCPRAEISGAWGEGEWKSLKTHEEEIF
ncbi:hypothetical protein, partial [Burkholderia glumae]|uniref:hypothetical protein n=1 Tax=Burkholderia glumae TaxID=337 RepID=UPI002036AF6C